MPEKLFSGTACFDTSTGEDNIQVSDMRPAGVDGNPASPPARGDGSCAPVWLLWDCCSLEMGLFKVQHHGKGSCQHQAEKQR